MLKNDFQKVSIIIPVYNEKDTFLTILKKAQDSQINGLSQEIIIVDDGSTDGTKDILANISQNGIKIFYHQKNFGKGEALQTGFSQASGDIIIIQDADLEYDPAEYQDLVKPILEGNADIVYGSRFVGDKPHRVLYFWHYLGNKIVVLFSNIVTNLNLTDVETCYKAFRKEVLDKIKLKEKGFGFENEFTIKAARQKFRFYEVGISYTGRTYQEGKKIKLRDAFLAMWCILRYGIFG
ncbi:glycosyl transferase [Candidatus Kuenenbacteria bacterium RIFCSPHIGHO2_12_FULL_42_14]|uniref:Glycosyl transferase family 2 n=3 Tax=Candidatus Kueneniibacteriota TaxID=1752740 RepID=A0A0G0Z202_9BACT|nr:MAG: Glycosyl transferase family 2 [Candidatus Kuenenbacteria bacterium GW2011_GWA2_42_15]OGG89481.1 MAG: glycosyl transferase [Candidatus Kuenenbacteria bacterium RIFCSPHIGHO2_02_FULL_42_29]OGG91812.1 MAG: glycosyl transferase [Candidatus Kuenenbacteria bacterium RIFCSPLOWO2_02_FULL_42_16]OGG98707.1 MAG: glycosyl transferase [Candidatus Kuenenbacteria bacterium RIFCSPHIGHO2_12_FULL_42_14]